MHRNATISAATQDAKLNTAYCSLTALMQSWQLMNTAVKDVPDISETQLDEAMHNMNPHYWHEAHHYHSDTSVLQCWA